MILSLAGVCQGSVQINFSRLVRLVHWAILGVCTHQPGSTALCLSRNGKPPFLTAKAAFFLIGKEQ